MEPLLPPESSGSDVVVIVGTPGLTSFAQVQAAMIDVGVYTVTTL